MEPISGHNPDKAAKGTLYSDLAALVQFTGLDAKAIEVAKSYGLDPTLPARIKVLEEKMVRLEEQQQQKKSDADKLKEIEDNYLQLKTRYCIPSCSWFYTWCGCWFVCC
jgi:hypothetical protein